MAETKGQPGDSVGQWCLWALLSHRSGLELCLFLLPCSLGVQRFISRNLISIPSSTKETSRA